MMLNERCAFCGGFLVIHNARTAGCVDCGNVTMYGQNDEVRNDTTSGFQGDRSEVFFNGGYTTFEDED